MADKDFVVKNGLVVNSSFVANSTQVTLGTINTTSIGLLFTNNYLTIGNSTVNVVINSTSISVPTAAGAATLGGATIDNIKTWITDNSAASYTNSTTFSANATNLTNGTIPYGRFPVNIINTTADFTRTGTTTFNNNVIIGTTGGISANGGYGNSGQSLLSNGTSVYWTTLVGGSNTYIQFNDSGTLGSNALFVYNKLTSTLTIGNSTVYTTTNTTSFSGSAATLGGDSLTVVKGYITSNSSAAYSNAVAAAATDATTKSNAAYANAVAAAATDATTKSNAAYSNAMTNSSADATTKSNAAYSNAVAAAATDATTKSNAAFANASARADSAYSNASSFATTKSDAAYSNAVSYVNNNTRAYANSTNNLGISGSSATATTATYLSTTAQTNQINVQALQGAGSLLNATGGLGGIMVQGGGGANAAFMSFHRPGAWAAYFGIDTDNQFAVGGWSAGAALAQFKCLGLGVGTAAIGGGVIAATGDIYSAYSDERLKTKLGPITDALDKVKSLNGFFYQPNDTALALGFNDKIERRVGVSAQEIQAVLPEAVHPAPKDNTYLTVQYEKIVPLLIEAIKELSAKLDAKCSNCSCGGK
jgi:hypothetical protein